MNSSWLTTSLWAAVLIAGVTCGGCRSLSASTFDDKTQSNLRMRPNALESLFTLSKFRKSGSSPRSLSSR